MPKKRVLTSLLPCYKVKVKGRGQGQRSGSRSRSNCGCAAVDIRDSALPSAAKSHKSHYQSKMFVCVSVIKGRIRIIARTWSIAILYLYAKVDNYGSP